MKATYNWIKQYVPEFDGDIAEMCERFTMSGTEVETWEAVGDDWVIEFSVTSNRVDCLGIHGLARDFAAATGLPLLPLETEFPTGSKAVEDACSIEIEDAVGCPRYTAHVIEGIVVGPSPDWLVQRLEAMGLRAVNNVVDVTNFALFETNQPFHAFDLDKLEGGRIIVRRGRDGESITAINDKQYGANADTTLITDPSGPIAIGGVMGGLATEVSAATTRVLLETAAFEPLGIRATSKRLALSSDSAFRFERGVDGQRVLEAAQRCVKLLLEVCGGEARAGVVDVGSTNAETLLVPFRYTEVERITGVSVDWATCERIFLALGISVDGDPETGITVGVPSWRPDIYREIDLVEEVIRNHGLHHLPLESGMAVRAVRESESEAIRRRAVERLVAGGFHETLTTSFVSEGEGRVGFFSDVAPVTISNAMRQEENALRQSLLPSMLKVRKTNQDRGNQDVRVAEATVVYVPTGAGIPDHLPILGGLLDGDYRAARGVVESVVAGLRGGELRFAPIDEAAARYLDADGGAIVMLGDTVLGVLGRPTAALVAANDLKSTPWYFELRLDRLAEHAELVASYAVLSKLPAIQRDLAMVVDESVAWGTVEAQIRSLGLSHLEDLQLFDIYRGKQVGKGKKSLAFSLTFRASERTLTNEEVDGEQSRCVESLREKLSAEIRG